MQKFGIQRIVRLVHHGRGPVHTCLVKPCFITGIVEYAEAFARRYPWVQVEAKGKGLFYTYQSNLNFLHEKANFH